MGTRTVKKGAAVGRGPGPTEPPPLSRSNKVELSASPQYDVRVIAYNGPAVQPIDLSPDQADELGLRLIREAARCRTLRARGPERDNAGI